MPFTNYLKELVSSIGDAEGAVMVAGDGEPVAEALGRDLDKYGLQLLGAQLSPMLNALGKIHQDIQLTPVKSMAIRGLKRVLFVHSLKDQYYILLSVRSGSGLVGAEQKLMAFAEKVNREI